jgi:hypothetical protein
VLCLDAANPKSNPSTGTAWTDLSGNGNNGTLVNGTTITQKNSILFDGSGDFLTLTNLTSTYLNSDFCIEAWVYLNNQSNQMFFNTIPHNSFGISLNRSGSGQTSTYIGNGTFWQTLDFRSSGTLALNQWHHVAVTRNNNAITIWHNGVAQGTTTQIMPTGFGTSAYIGTYNGGAGEYINGKIYGYRIVSGNPVYTTNFTPPSSVYSISGTQLIVAQDGGIKNSSGSAVTVTASGNTSVELENAAVFDGVNDYASTIFTRGALGNQTTLAAWYRYAGTSSRGFSPIFGGIEPGGGGTEFFLGKDSGNTNIGIQDGNYSGSFVTGSNAFDGNYHYFVYSYDNGTGKVYLDGLLKNTGTFSKCNDSEQIAIAIERDGSSAYFFIGNIPQASIYNRALSPQEIQQNFNALRGRYSI